MVTNKSARKDRCALLLQKLQTQQVSFALELCWLFGELSIMILPDSNTLDAMSSWTYIAEYKLNVAADKQQPAVILINGIRRPPLQKTLNPAI